MKGSEFIAAFGPKDYAAWEAAAFEAASSGSLVQWPWTEVVVSDGNGNTIVLHAQSDVCAIGTPEDFVRVPLPPSRYQQIANLFGYILATPKLAYEHWRASQVKLTPISMNNKGMSPAQAVQHNDLIEAQRAGRAGSIGGAKKLVVISNIWKFDKVVIFGWYRPAPDVFDDKQPMTAPNRQPIQPLSNFHGAYYWDYSHGALFFHPICQVNGVEMLLTDVMQHPVLWKLVSHEGPLKVVRYPAPNAPQGPPPPVSFSPPSGGATTASSFEEFGLSKVVEDFQVRHLLAKR